MIANHYVSYTNISLLYNLDMRPYHTLMFVGSVSLLDALLNVVLM